MQPSLAKLMVASTAAQAVSALNCSPGVFSSVGIPKGEVLSLTATLAETLPAQQTTNNWPIFSNTTTLTCQVTIQYTHPGWNDTINTYVWLPVEDWNGRFVGVGGGGWAAGNPTDLGLQVARGYAAVITDGGHPFERSDDLDYWAIVGKDSVNWYNMLNFFSVALDDAATLGKAAVAAYYGREQEYSYWNGCSTGGRQGLMMAQRYPEQYDGILAAAPAINWNQLVVSMYLPVLTMRSLDYYPSNCELNAITSAAVEACDEADGLEDDVVVRFWECDFDPSSVVGHAYSCGNETGVITSEAAEIASSIWRGSVFENGRRAGWGLAPSAPLIGIANVNCSTPGACEPAPFIISPQWISTFVLENSDADLSSLTYEEYLSLFRLSANKYTSLADTNDPDLTDFKLAGGKMITWHGGDDELIPFNSTVDYYEKVAALDADILDYYRFFSAPGVQHCQAGAGWFPGEAFESLVDWVENGKAPESLYGRPRGLDFIGEREANLCLYPKQIRYIGGDPEVASSFECQ